MLDSLCEQNVFHLYSAVVVLMRFSQNADGFQIHSPQMFDLYFLKILTVVVNNENWFCK